MHIGNVITHVQTGLLHIGVLASCTDNCTDNVRVSEDNEDEFKINFCYF